MGRLSTSLLGRSLFGLLALIVGVFPPNTRAEGDLSFCIENKDVRPWILREGKGLNIEILDRVAQKLGLNFVYRKAPWQRCFDALKRGEIDGIVGVSYKAERTQYGSYPGGQTPDVRKRLNYDKYVLVRRKGSPVLWDGKTITGLDGAIGTQFGYSVTELLFSQGVRVDQGSPGGAELLHKLSLGRVAAAAMLEGEAKALLASSEFQGENLEIIPIPLVEKPYYLLLSNRLAQHRGDLASAIWNSIEIVRETAEYQRLESIRSEISTCP